MNESIKTLRNIFDGYTDIVEELYKKAKAQDDAEAMKELRVIWDRLQQGPIRAVVMGVSSAGKSTVLNALSGSIVVPEGSHTTSPVPVWIYSDGKAQFSPDVRIYKTKGENTLPSAKNNNIGIYPFITDYCYTPTEAARGTARDKNTGKDKYEDVAAAAVNVNVETQRIYKSGITFVDTPGIGVSIGDNVRVDDVISCGCEFVVVVFREMHKETKDFLRSQFVENEAPLRDILKKGRVYAVHNYTDAGTDADAVAQIESTFDGQLKDRLFMINARYARQQNCGYYDYKGLLPNSSRNDVAKEVAANMQNERSAIAEVETREDLQGLWKDSQEQLNALWEALEGGVARLLEQPEDLLAPVCSRINGCVKKLVKRNEDKELTDRLNKLNEQCVELSKQPRSKQNKAKQADYDKRVQIVRHLFSDREDSYISKCTKLSAEKLLKDGCEAFGKAAELQKHSPLADESGNSHAVSVKNIEDDNWCGDLLYGTIVPRMKKMNEYLLSSIAAEKFGSENCVSFTACINNSFSIVKNNIPNLEGPLCGGKPWYGEGTAKEISDRFLTAGYASKLIPLIKQNPLDMQWYDNKMMEICKTAHERAEKTVRDMDPLIFGSTQRNEVMAFLKNSQQRVKTGGFFRGGWAKAGVNVDLEYQHFAPFIKDGIKKSMEKYCAVYKDEFLKGFNAEIYDRLIKNLTAACKKTIDEYEKQIDTIKKTMILKW